jgi:hypothetical protein
MCGGVAAIHGLYYDFGLAALKDGLYIARRQEKADSSGKNRPSE